MKTILCFGNEFVEQDSLAKIIADEIKSDKHRFKKCDSVDDVLKHQADHPGEEMTILDVVKGLKKTRLLELDQLKTDSIVSLHDFDLAFFLKLLEKTGQLEKLKIIGIPMSGDKEEIKKDILGLL